MTRAFDRAPGARYHRPSPFGAQEEHEDMYAIIDAGGRQVRVAKGETIRVDRRAGEVGDAVTFDRVLLVGGDALEIGTPVVEGASVRGRLVAHGRGPKIIVQKYKPKNRYKITRGHRQDYTQVAIEAIDLPKRSKAAKPAEPPADA